MISFNCSIAGDKSFLKEYKENIQFMVTLRNVLSLNYISSFPKIDEERIACIHVSYITRPFSEKFFEEESYQVLNMYRYLYLAKRIGFKYVLIHGPESYREWKFMDSTLKKLKQMVEDPAYENKVNIIIEMPSFKGDFIQELTKEGNCKGIDYIYYYFDKIVPFFDIVPDTAHLYANGCSVDDMINVFERYKNNIKICHLNGNKNGQFHSDAHCPIFSSKNQIKEIEKLVDYLSSTDLILITENTSDGVSYDKWKSYAEKHNMKIIKENDRLAT